MLRRVLVTGAGSGVGLATALHLAGLGFAVTGLVPAGEEEEALLSAAAEGHQRIDVVEADLSDPLQREGLVTGMDLWGLVNNAGYMNAGQVRDVPLDDARAAMLPFMRARARMIGRGRSGEGRRPAG